MAAGRLAGRLSRLTGRGGSAIPGVVAGRIDPRVIERLIAGIPVVVVTGTNGKTTTTKMLVGILEAAGRRVLTNRTGSNLAQGIAGCLIEAAGWSGRIDADLAVFEIDEAAVRRLAPRLRPRLLVVTNLARDQLDRFGELATTASHVAEALQHAEAAVLNADDPMVAALGGAPVVRRFGAVPAIRESMPHDGILYGGADAAPPAARLDARLERADPEGDGRRVEISVGTERVEAALRVPGVYNGYNAAAALLAAAELGVDPAGAAGALEAMTPAFGRGQVVEFRGRRVKLLLVKNPAGLNQVIRLLGDAPPGPVLVAINDLDADGRDVSWLWDARVEELAATGHRFSAGGLRAHDMALRFKYAGIEAPAEPDIGAALDRLVDATGPAETAYVVPTYTAMLEFVDRLHPDAHRREVWT
jgi:UDP-N-acetylmuramyl tripeptide synthase